MFEACLHIETHYDMCLYTGNLILQELNRVSYDFPGTIDKFDDNVRVFALWSSHQWGLMGNDTDAFCHVNIFQHNWTCSLESFFASNILMQVMSTFRATTTNPCTCRTWKLIMCCHSKDWLTSQLVPLYEFMWEHDFETSRKVTNQAPLRMGPF